MPASILETTAYIDYNSVINSYSKDGNTTSKSQSYTKPRNRKTKNDRKLNKNSYNPKSNLCSSILLEPDSKKKTKKIISSNRNISKVTKSKSISRISKNESHRRAQSSFFHMDSILQNVGLIHKGNEHMNQRKHKNKRNSSGLMDDRVTDSLGCITVDEKDKSQNHGQHKYNDCSLVSLFKGTKPRDIAARDNAFKRTKAKQKKHRLHVKRQQQDHHSDSIKLKRKSRKKEYQTLTERKHNLIGDSLNNLQNCSNSNSIPNSNIRIKTGKHEVFDSLGKENVPPVDSLALISTSIPHNEGKLVSKTKKKKKENEKMKKHKCRLVSPNEPFVEVYGDIKIDKDMSTKSYNTGVRVRKEHSHQSLANVNSQIAYALAPPSKILPLNDAEEFNDCMPDSVSKTSSLNDTKEYNDFMPDSVSPIIQQFQESYNIKTQPIKLSPQTITSLLKASSNFNCLLNFAQNFENSEKQNIALENSSTSKILFQQNPNYSTPTNTTTMKPSKQKTCLFEDDLSNEQRTNHKHFLTPLQNPKKRIDQRRTPVQYRINNISILSPSVKEQEKLQQPEKITNIKKSKSSFENPRKKIDVRRTPPHQKNVFPLGMSNIRKVALATCFEVKDPNSIQLVNCQGVKDNEYLNSPLCVLSSGSFESKAVIQEKEDKIITSIASSISKQLRLSSNISYDDREKTKLEVALINSEFGTSIVQGNKRGNSFPEQDKSGKSPSKSVGCLVLEVEEAKHLSNLKCCVQSNNNSIAFISETSDVSNEFIDETFDRKQEKTLYGQLELNNTTNSSSITSIIEKISPSTHDGIETKIKKKNSKNLSPKFSNGEGIECEEINKCYEMNHVKEVIETIDNAHEIEAVEITKQELNLRRSSRQRQQTNRLTYEKKRSLCKQKEKKMNEEQTSIRLKNHLNVKTGNAKIKTNHASNGSCKNKNKDAKANVNEIKLSAEGKSRISHLHDVEIPLASNNTPNSQYNDAIKHSLKCTMSNYETDPHTKIQSKDGIKKKSKWRQILDNENTNKKLNYQNNRSDIRHIEPGTCNRKQMSPIHKMIKEKVLKSIARAKKLASKTKSTSKTKFQLQKCNSWQNCQVQNLDSTHLQVVSLKDGIDPLKCRVLSDKESNKHDKGCITDVVRDDEDDIFNSTPMRCTLSVKQNPHQDTIKKKNAMNAISNNERPINLPCAFVSPIMYDKNEAHNLNPGNMEESPTTDTPISLLPKSKCYIKKLKRRGKITLFSKRKFKDKRSIAKTFVTNVGNLGIKLNGRLSPNGAIHINAPTDNEIESNGNFYEYSDGSGSESE